MHNPAKPKGRAKKKCGFHRKQSAPMLPCNSNALYANAFVNTREVQTHFDRMLSAIWFCADKFNI